MSGNLQISARSVGSGEATLGETQINVSKKRGAASNGSLQHNQGSFGRLYAVPGSESTPEPLFVDLKFSPHGQRLLVELEASTRAVQRARNGF